MTMMLKRGKGKQMTRDEYKRCKKIALKRDLRLLPLNLVIFMTIMAILIPLGSVGSLILTLAGTILFVLVASSIAGRIYTKWIESEQEKQAVERLRQAIENRELPGQENSEE